MNNLLEACRAVVWFKGSCSRTLGLEKIGVLALVLPLGTSLIFLTISPRSRFPHQYVEGISLCDLGNLPKVTKLISDN